MANGAVTFSDMIDLCSHLELDATAVARSFVDEHVV